MADMARKGHDFKDYICPDGIEKHSDYLKLGERYCRVLFLKDYANYIQDEIVANLTDLDRNMMLSIDILNVPTDEAVREVENRLLGVETNITNWQRRQNQNNNFSAIVPYDMELQRRESKEFLADLTTRDQRMMQAVLTLVLTADTKQQLDTDTEKIRSLSGRCQLAVLKYQQIDGLNTVLPIGTRKINAFRTLTTESLAVFMPFKVQEIMDRGGIYFGENAMKSAFIRSKRKAEALLDNRQATPGEYAVDKTELAADDLAHDAANVAASGAKTAVRQIRKLFQRQREKRSSEKHQENTAPAEQAHSLEPAQGTVPEGRLPRQRANTAPERPRLPGSGHTAEHFPTQTGTERPTDTASPYVERGRAFAKKRTERKWQVKNQAVPSDRTPRIKTLSAVQAPRQTERPLKMALRVGWTGAPALFPGVPTSAAIWMPA